MSHNSLVRSPVSNWINGSTISSTIAGQSGKGELGLLDAGLASAINGDDGGVWNPTSPIVIGGAGLQVNSFVYVTYGATLTTLAAPSIFCNANDWPLLDPSNSFQNHVVVDTFCNGVGIPSWLFFVHIDGSLQAMAASYALASSGVVTPIPAAAFVKMRAHDRSTILGVVISFKVAALHTQLPSVMPAARVVRVDKNGNTTPLTSQVAGGDTRGFVSVPAPVSPAAWYNLGQAQQLLLVCDQNNVVDVSQYDYRIELVDEQGMPGNGTAFPFLLEPALPIANWQPSLVFGPNMVVLPTPPHSTGAIFAYTLPYPVGGLITDPANEPDWASGPNFGDLVVDNPSGLGGGPKFQWTNIGPPLGTIWLNYTTAYTKIADLRPQ